MLGVDCVRDAPTLRRGPIFAVELPKLSLGTDLSLFIAWLELEPYTYVRPLESLISYSKINRKNAKVASTEMLD